MDLGELLAAVLVATQGAVDPRMVLTWRMDFVLMLCRGRSMLMRRSQSASIAAPDSTPSPTRIRTEEQLWGFIRSTQPVGRTPPVVNTETR